MNKNLYCLSEKGKNRTVEQLKKNLISIIDFKPEEEALYEAPASEADVLVSTEKLNTQKENLKKLVDLEVAKIGKIGKSKSGQPPAKKKRFKTVDKGSESNPVINCLEDLVGKQVEHLIT